MKDAQLYGVNDGKFYKRSPPTHGSDDWLGSAEMIGSGGWKVFKFLITPLKDVRANCLCASLLRT